MSALSRFGAWPSAVVFSRLRAFAGRREQADDMPSAPGGEHVFQRDHLRELAALVRSAMPITIRRSMLWPTSMPAFTA